VSSTPHPRSAQPTRSVRASLAIAVILALQAPAMTSANELSLPRIELIEVVGANQGITNQPGSVQIINSVDMERIQPVSTEDVLRRIPGVHIKGEEESAVVANIGIRGLSAADYKTLILEDGVPVAPGLFVGNQRYYNPRIQRMEGIEVLKGSASLRFGPNTIGGVINYKTREPVQGVSVSARVASHDYKEVTLEAGGISSSGDAKAGIFYTRAQSDGFQNKGFNMEDLMLKGGMALGGGQSIAAKFTHYKNDANISYRGLFLDAFNSGASYNPAPDDYFITARTSLDLNHKIAFSDAVTLNTLAYWNEMNRDYWRYAVNNTDSVAAGRWVYTDNLAGNNRSFERYGLDSRLSISHASFGMNNHAEVGVRLMEEDMHDQQVNAVRATPRTGTISTDRIDAATGIAFFAQNRFDVSERFSVTPGLRIETYEQKREDLRNSANDGKTSNTEYLPGVGATFDVSESAQVYGGVYKAFSPPLNSQSLVSGVDQQLDAERSVNLEVGVRGNQGAFGYELTAFQMDFDNQITPGITGGLANANAGSTMHRGGEAALDYFWKNGFSLAANITWIPTSEYLEDRGGGINKSNRLPYSPELVANLVAEYSTGPFRTALVWSYIGSQFGDGDNSVPITGSGNSVWKGKLPSYNTVDLTASYDVTEQFKLTGAVKNLTNERYIAGLRQGIYAGPERSFEVAARYSF